MYTTFLANAFITTVLVVSVAIILWGTIALAYDFAADCWNKNCRKEEDML